MMNNLYLRIVLPAALPNKTVHSKAIGSSQSNESDFAELSQMPQCTNGTPPGLLIGDIFIIFFMLIRSINYYKSIKFPDKMLGALVGRKLMETSCKKSFSHLTSRSAGIVNLLAIKFCCRDPKYQPTLDLVETEVEPAAEDDYKDFIETVEIKDHPFDHTSLRPILGACDYPARKQIRGTQIKGTQGPRFFNRITPSEQLAQFINKSVESML